MKLLTNKILLYILAIAYTLIHFIIVSRLVVVTITVDHGHRVVYPVSSSSSSSSSNRLLLQRLPSAPLLLVPHHEPPKLPQNQQQHQSKQQQQLEFVQQQPKQQPKQQRRVIVVVPGHGTPRRLPNLKRSMQSLRKSCQRRRQDPTSTNMQFECLVLVYQQDHVVTTTNELDFCTVQYNPGLWTDHMRKASDIILSSQHNNNYNNTTTKPDHHNTMVVLMMDDIDATSVQLPLLIDTMVKVGYEAASPSLPGWQTSSLLQRRHCLAHRTDHIDILFTVFSPSAWECWNNMVNMGKSKNYHGWGYDLTFYDVCHLPLGVIDHEMAMHDPDECQSGGDCSERTYNSTIARQEMDQWLIDANVGVHTVAEADAYFKQIAFLRPQTFPYCDLIQLHLPSEEFYKMTTHRGGWKTILERAIHDLQIVSTSKDQYHQSQYVHLIDCIEEWFLWGHRGPIMEQDWIGITHMLTRDLLPDHQAQDPTLVLDTYFDLPDFASSAARCVALVFFTKEIEQAASKQLQAKGYPTIQTCVIRHPIAVEDDVVEFNPMIDLPIILSDQSAIILLGQQYRRIATLHKLNFTGSIRRRKKIWLPSRTDPEFIDRRTQQELAIENVTMDSTIVVQRVESNDHYDQLVKQNIVIIDFWAAAANNAIMEAIALKAPFFIRRLPGPEEYIGKDYPLFFSSVDELENIISNTVLLEDALKRGHEYLQTIDQTKFSLDYFVQSLQDCALKGLNHEKAHPGTFPPGVSPAL